MKRVTTGSAETDKSLLAVFLGFVGVTAVIMLLPRTVTYVIRRFVLGTIAEIVAVVVSALFAEKIAHLVAEDDDLLESADTEL